MRIEFIAYAEYQGKKVLLGRMTPRVYYDPTKPLVNQYGVTYFESFDRP